VEGAWVGAKETKLKKKENRDKNKGRGERRFLEGKTKEKGGGRQRYI